MKRNDSPFFTPEQKTLITEHLLKGAPEFEIERFLITCERTGLDPFSRQIYGHIQNKKIKRGGQDAWIPTVVIITSIDGFRAIAERTGQYRGQTKPEWYYMNDEGVADWRDVFITVRDQRGNPLRKPDACRVGIIREGFADPCYGVANFESFAKYYKADGSNDYVLETFWKKMPEHMIAKIAEAQGHRKAFPLLAQGLYIEEEIRDDDEPTPPSSSPDELPPGMTWAEGQSPSERAAAAKKLAATPPETAKTDNVPSEPEKPRSEAPASEKKASRKKSEPASAPVEPQTDPSDQLPGIEEPAQPAWMNYVISQITIAKLNGKKLSELSPADIAGLKTLWVDKYADKIKTNPAKVAEAAQITAAHEHYQKAEK